MNQQQELSFVYFPEKGLRETSTPLMSPRASR